jgi:hypothetical protein
MAMALSFLTLAKLDRKLPAIASTEKISAQEFTIAGKRNLSRLSFICPAA